MGCWLEEREVGWEAIGGWWSDSVGGWVKTRQGRGAHARVCLRVAHSEGSACDAVRCEAILGPALPIPY